MSRHSNDLRKRAIAFLNKGTTKSETIRTFNISRETLYRWIRQDKEGKLYEIKQYHHGSKSKVDLQKLVAFVDANQDLYYEEIGKVFNTAPSNIHKILKKIGYTNKKNRQDIEKLKKKK